MSKICTSMVMVLTLAGTTSLRAQNVQADSTGLPGDNFSLQGALDMFKRSGSPEELEKLINTQDNGINNLDLNGDGQIDYVKVVAKQQGDVHVFVLQDVISESESQDIAVIELQKTGDANAIVQIVGDEDIYGDSTIIEPRSESNAYQNTSASNEDLAVLAGGHGPNIAFTPSNIGIVVNVWAWPCVRFVYAPAYRPWVSPWGWRRYPVYWHPWRPLAWTYYRPVRYRYYPHYTVVRTNRVVVARTIYRPARVTSVTVYNRNRVVVNNYRTTHVTRRPTVTHNRGQYTTTRRATTVAGPRGGMATRRTTTVTGPRGNTATRNRTTVRRRH